MTSNSFSSTILEFRNVDMEFRNKFENVKALKNISFKIYSGQIGCLVGPSGSGKSTILHLAGAFIYPTRGIVLHTGQNLKDFDEKEISYLRNRKIGFVFQSFNLFPTFTVYENVIYPTKIFKEKNLKAISPLDLIETVGLGSKLKKKPNQLSGGEKQRVAIARALVNNPDIIYADEPTANLDYKTGEKIIDLFFDLNHRFGTTLLFSSHDPRVFERISEKIFICDGEIESEKS